MSNKKYSAVPKEFKNHNVLVFDDFGSVTHHNIFSIEDSTVETESCLLPLKDALKVYNNNNGGFTYVFNLPEVAKVQAEELKSLRRSKAIKNIMSFETDKSLDLGKMFPYIVALAALIFS